MIGLDRIQQWFKNASINGASAPYEIVCACGQVCRGSRHARHQVVRCSICRREMFVLPVSPLPRVVPPGGESSIAQLPPTRSRLWLGPVAAVGLTLSFLIVAVVCWIYFSVLPSRSADSSRASLADIESQVAEGRKSLADGNYAEAVESLTKAQSNLAGQLNLFTPAERRRLAQLHRQAAILADWPHESLDKILARTGSLNDDEWRAVAAGYKGKSTVLDLAIRRDAARQYQVNFPRPMAVARLRLELHNQKLLDSLPLDAPQRVVFAVRIAEIRREDQNGFSARFDPDTAVLLTDVNTNLLTDIPEATLRALLQQQQTWGADLP
jgi:hypothetical protein